MRAAQHEGRRRPLPRHSPGHADRPVDLEGRINLCRTANQQAEPFAPESRELLSLAAYVALQSRGQPIAPPDDPRLAPFREQGAEIYRRRQGQLNLSCAICHDDNAGKKLAGVTIPEAHPTGYPIYRLEWQALGSLKRRLRNCLVGIRAEAYAYDAPRIRGARDLSDGPRQGHGPRRSRRTALTEGKYSPAPAPGRRICCAMAIFGCPFHCRCDPRAPRVSAC